LKPAWALQFKIEDSVWTELVREAALVLKTPLSLAFEKGHLNENHFISWERERSGLASLKALYFNGQRPVDLWTHFDFKVCAQDFCMPVANWDGHVYWAKLSSEPVAFESELEDVIWVLAPWSAMKKWFGQWQLEVSVAIPSPVQATASGTFSGFQASDTGQMPAHIDSSEAVSFDETEVKENIEIVEDYSGPPQGLKIVSAEKTLASIDFGNIMSLVAPVPALQKNDSQSAVPVFNLESVVTTNPSISLLNNQIEVTFATPLPPPLPQALALEITIPSQIDLNEISLVPLETLDERLATAKNQDECGNLILGGLQNYFDKVMILLIQGTSLAAWRWSGQWFGNFQRGEILSLTTPSVFKITATTQHPFHGQASHSPANDRFFQITNGNQYPEHVTVLPVITNGACVALIVGCCAPDIGRKLNLHRLEEQTAIFAKSYNRHASPIPRAG
jgi:hypothetical protein